MLTYTLPPYNNYEEHPKIETISQYIGSPFNKMEKKSSIYFLSKQDINITDEHSLFTRQESSIFQEYFLMKAIETLYNSIKNEQERFFSEKLELPNQRSIEDACYILNVLSTQNIYPTIITPTIEEGICLTFHKTHFRLYFEFYNSGEIGYIIEDSLSKKTLENEDLKSIDDIPNIVEKFLQ